MHKYTALKNLHAARKSFVPPKVPDVIHFEKSDHVQAYSVWKLFNEHVNKIIETQKFEDVELSTQSERGRVTRSQMRSYLSSGNDKEDFRSIGYHKFKLYVTYIDSLVGNLQQRFESWPEWVILRDLSFNFLNDLDDSDRQIAFETLI